MKRPELLLLVIVWEFLNAVAVLIGLGVIAVFAFPEVIRSSESAELAGLFGLSIAVLVLLCFGGIALAGGIGLLKRKRWGRTMSIIHAAISVLNVPIGTVVGALTILYLTRTEVVAYFVGVKDDRPFP
jgi:uncharacterized membrane protein (DUF2068 family)